MSVKNDSRLRRARKSRQRMRTQGVSRLSVHRTPRHIYAQVFAPAGDRVLVSASTLDGSLQGRQHGQYRCGGGRRQARGRAGPGSRVSRRWLLIAAATSTTGG
jgi:hypothetical protein